MDFINFNNSYNVSSSYTYSKNNPNTLYFPTNGNAIIFNGEYYGFAYLAGNISMTSGTLSVQDIRPYNNSNISSFTANSLTLKPGDVCIYNGTSGLNNLSITIFPSSSPDSSLNSSLAHYKIILKTGSSTASTFLTANYQIMLPPSCSQKLDANSIYEIDLELVYVAGSYKLLTVISKFS